MKSTSRQSRRRSCVSSRSAHRHCSSARWQPHRRSCLESWSRARRRTTACEVRRRSADVARHRASVSCPRLPSQSESTPRASCSARHPTCRHTSTIPTHCSMMLSCEHPPGNAHIITYSASGKRKCRTSNHQRVDCLVFNGTFNTNGRYRAIEVWNTWCRACGQDDTQWNKTLNWKIRSPLWPGLCGDNPHHTVRLPQESFFS